MALNDTPRIVVS